MPKTAYTPPEPRDPKEPYPLNAEGLYVFTVRLKITADPAFLGEDLRVDELNAKVLESINYSPFLKSVDIISD
jgi:hypothetical protein